MAIAAITKSFVDSVLRKEKGSVLYYDSKLSGFGLRAGHRSASYFCEGRIRGRTARITIGRHDRFTPDQARKLAMAHLAAMAQGQDPRKTNAASAASALTVEEAFDGFFRAKTNLQPNTVTTYKRSINLYLAAWRKKPIGEIDRAMALDAHKRITKEHGGTTANNALRHFRSVYNFTSVSVGELPTNPVQVISQSRSWSAERRRQTYIPPQALARWYAIVRMQHPTVRDVFLMALLTGMRRMEVLALRWSSIDLDGQALHLARTKNGEALDLPLSKPLVSLLRARRAADPDGDWVFPSHGRSGHFAETKVATDRISKASGVQFTMHDLRRTFITIAESLDVPHYALKRLLNHKSGGDVTAGYIVITTDRLRGPVDKIASHIEALLQGDRREAA